MTATLWLPGRFPGINELVAAAKGAGGTGRYYSHLKATWTDRVWIEATSRRTFKFPGAVFIDFTWIEANKRRDPDNISGGGRKVILDGLVKAGVLKKDGWKTILGWMDRFEVNEERPGVGIVIHDRSIIS